MVSTRPVLKPPGHPRNDKNRVIYNQKRPPDIGLGISHLQALTATHHWRSSQPLMDPGIRSTPSTRFQGKCRTFYILQLPPGSKVTVEPEPSQNTLPGDGQ
jgi:hypothetical protein